MIVIIQRDGYRFRIAEFIAEKPKIYKVSSIDALKWANRFFGSQIRKEDAIYKGELLPIADIIDNWNTLSEQWSKEKDSINEKYRKMFEEIVSKIQEQK